MEIKDVDENRQSRSIATFGLENMKKFSKLKVFIYGVNGVSLEASKNLVLNGIKKLTIYDENISKSEDLSWNFFLNEKDINKKRRDETILLKLKELNNYVEVIIERNLEKALNDNDIIVYSKIQNSEEIYKINDFCRENKKGFLYDNLFGLAGFDDIYDGRGYEAPSHYGFDSAQSQILLPFRFFDIRALYGA